MPDWLQTVIASSAVTAAAIWIIQRYVLARIKHDFDLRLEALKPLTAEDTLKRQNYLNSKRDAFFDAVAVVSRHLEAVPWSGSDIPADRPVSGQRPSEAEVNTCLAKLSLYSDDPAIPEAFLSCFADVSPVSLGHFIDQLRRDLGYGALPSAAERYKYFFRREPEQG